MRIEHNPLFLLAQMAYEEGIPEAAVIARPENRLLIKKCRNKRHYDEVIDFVCTSVLETNPYSELVPHLAATALKCASQNRIKGKVWGGLNLMAAQVLVCNLDVEGALRSLRKAQKAFLRAQDLRGYAITQVLTTSIGSLFFGKVSAKEMCSTWLTRSENPSRTDRKTRPHFLVAVALYSAGEYERAFQSISEWSKEVFGEEGERIRPLVDLLAASCLYGMGKYDQAYDLLVGIDEIPDSNLSPMLRIQVHLAAGVSLRSLGQYPQAIDRFKRAIELGEKEANPRLLLHGRMILAVTYLNCGEFEQAGRILFDATTNIGPNRGQLYQSECMARLGVMYGDIGRSDEGLTLLQSARQVFSRRNRPRQAAICDSYMAWIHAEAGNHTEAVELFQEVARSYRDLQSPMLSFEVAHGQGLAYLTAGNLEAARRHLEAGIAVLEMMRSGLRRDEYRLDFFASHYRIYFRLIDCLLKLGDSAAALEYLERLKSRNLADLLSGRDLGPRNATEQAIDEYRSLRLRMRALSLKMQRQDTTKGWFDEYFELYKEYDQLIGLLREKEPDFDPDQTGTISCEEIRKLVLDDQTALIELFPMDDKTVAFVFLPSEDVANTTVTIEDYTYEDVEHDLEKVRHKEDLEGLLEKLYTTIYVPIEPFLTGIKKLILIPYSGLHLIPLHAMFTVENGLRRYLVDDYLITYAPSAKILKASLKRDVTRGKEAFVAFSNPRDDLPYSIHEAESIARQFETQVVANVTRGNIIQHGLNAGVFHFTGHADGTALILHGEDQEKQRDLYDVGDIFTSLSTPNAWLVTLSACDTGKIRLGTTDEYIGLPSAFLHAGAATVICSLWSVSDLSTTLLMSKMYELIAEDRGKAQALREAQLWLKDPENESEHRVAIEKLGLRPALSSADGLKDSRRFKRVSTAADSIRLDDLHKPYYWAGFICTGAP